MTASDPAPSLASTPKTAMVLAAGLGTRMRPTNGAIPKPLVQVAGKALIDYALDRLVAEEIELAVVNVHHLADTIETHLARRARPRIAISDERTALLNTGGGIAKALPLLGKFPFYLINSDTMWLDRAQPNLTRLAQAFRAERMDALLLLAPRASASGYQGRGDFEIDAGGRLYKRVEPSTAPWVYAGAALLSPRLFDDAPQDAFPLTLLFARAQAQGRLYGLVLDGTWMHVGTPEAIAAAEAVLRVRA